MERSWYMTYFLTKILKMNYNMLLFMSKIYLKEKEILSKMVKGENVTSISEYTDVFNAYDVADNILPINFKIELSSEINDEISNIKNFICSLYKEHHIIFLKKIVDRVNNYLISSALNREINSIKGEVMSGYLASDLIEAMSNYNESRNACSTLLCKLILNSMEILITLLRESATGMINECKNFIYSTASSLITANFITILKLLELYAEATDFMVSIRIDAEGLWSKSGSAVKLPIIFQREVVGYIVKTNYEELIKQFLELLSLNKLSSNVIKNYLKSQLIKTVKNLYTMKNLLNESYIFNYIKDKKAYFDIFQKIGFKYPPELFIKYILFLERSLPVRSEDQFVKYELNYLNNQNGWLELFVTMVLNALGYLVLPHVNLYVIDYSEGIETSTYKLEEVDLLAIGWDFDESNPEVYKINIIPIEVTHASKDNFLHKKLNKIQNFYDPLKNKLIFNFPKTLVVCQIDKEEEVDLSNNNIVMIDFRNIFNLQLMTMSLKECEKGIM